MPRTRAQRAQIFQSFDALKGFRELLKEQEKVIVQRKTLSEDDLEELDRKVHQIQIGMIITVIYFSNGQYIQLTGRVSKLNFNTKTIQIVKTKLNIKSIVDIEFE